MQSCKVHWCDFTFSDTAVDHGEQHAGTIDKMAQTTAPRRRNLDADEVSAFDHIADGLCERVRLIRTNLLPPAADGMTVGRFVFMRDDHIEHRASTLLAHELVHVRQFAEMGMPRFFASYFGSYFKNLARTRNHRQAYLDIPLEIEARRLAGTWAKSRAVSSEITHPKAPKNTE